MPTSLLDTQAAWLGRYTPELRVRELGRVVSVGDGIAWIDGLPSAAIDDVLALSDGSVARVFDLSADKLGAVLLQETAALTAGLQAQRTGRVLSITAGDELLGRIVDPIGNPLDGAPAPRGPRRPVESLSPPIVARDFVHEPLYFGVKAIDSMIPVGKGQRQLIIGDDGLGRSSLALDAVVNQRGTDVCCVYVLIGQKRSTTVNTIATLRDHDALGYTAVVVAEASALPGLQHIAPFAGCAIAEQWMHEGRDVLIVYDDLSTHARTYRELSLLIRRPPGREAYPGDVFSVHARLLERATCLNAEHGGGSMTALAIVETTEGEISSYIPTNLISITDGQIFLDAALFAGGVLPAIDIGRSVSRIGGQAQHPRIKHEAGRMKLDYLQFLELEAFTRFGARLEESVETAIERGRLLREILKQDRLTPMAPEFQLAWMIAYNDRLLDGTQPDAVAGRLDELAQATAQSDLTLDSAREQWSHAVAGWLANGQAPEA